MYIIVSSSRGYAIRNTSVCADACGGKRLLSGLTLSGGGGPPPPDEKLPPQNGLLYYMPDLIEKHIGGAFSRRFSKGFLRFL